MNSEYKKCQKNKMNEVMHEFKKGKLKTRSNQVIKSRKQAIAIGLTMSNNTCELKMDKNDYKKMEEKFNKDIYNQNTIRSKKLTLTTVKNSIKLLQHYKNNNEKTNYIINSLFKKILKELEKGEKINSLIIKDLLNYLK